MSCGGVVLGAAGLNAVSPKLWRQGLELDPNASYWGQSQSHPNPRLERDLDVDVAILGGGFTGLSSAYYVRKLSPQKRVAVLEARGCGHGASGRNGAMLLTMTEDRFMRFSSDLAEDARIYQLTAGNIRRLRKLSAETGIACELESNGALQVCLSAEDVRAARSYVERARPLGMPVEFWDGQQVARAIGASAYEGGFFDPNGGQVHPMKLVNVWKQAAEGSGAEIFENTAVVSVEEGPLHTLHLEGGQVVRAKSLVLATNAFTPNLGYFGNAVLPVREFVAMTRRLSAQERERTGWRLRIPFNDCRTQVYYLGMTADDRIHIGGGAPAYEWNGRAPDAAAADAHGKQLRRELTRLYPTLSEVEFEVTWSGAVDWSLNESPAVGQTGRYGNIFYGLGYSGHGVNLTSVFGEIIADLEAGRGERWKQFPFLNASLDYIPNEPFRWVAARAGLAWYGMTEP